MRVCEKVIITFMVVKNHSPNNGNFLLLCSRPGVSIVTRLSKEGRSQCHTLAQSDNDEDDDDDHTDDGPNDDEDYLDCLDDGIDVVYC